MRRFAISDIHGCAKTFKALLKQINFTKTDELYLLGDYIDRGPDSKGVIDYIWQLQAEGYTVHCLRGNHEQMLIHEVQNPILYAEGEANMLRSFGVKNSKEIPKKYIEWMEKLPYYLEVGKFILVHAGLNFKIYNPLTDLEEMLWTRYWIDSIDYNWLGDRVVIHGHTPTRQLEMVQYGKVLNTVRAMVIDNGCALHGNGFGNLAALDLDENRLHFHACID